MKNVLLICRKELKSYFASPIAYLLMAFFALIFGFGFYTATRDFVRFSFQAQMMGQSQPMNVNEQIIRPLLGFASTVALFLIPMITMRLFAEEKTHRHHRTAAHFAGRRYRDHPRQVAGRHAAVPVRAGHVGDQHRHAVRLGQAGLKPVLVAYLGLILQGGMPAGHRRRSSPPPRGTRSSPAASPSSCACCCGC